MGFGSWRFKSSHPHNHFKPNPGTHREQTIQMGTPGEPSREATEARQVGLDLLDATSRFDRPMGVARGGDPVDFALIAFAVRGRRLMRAAYRLIDADEPDVANALFRVMSEYLIVGTLPRPAREAAPTPCPTHAGADGVLGHRLPQLEQGARDAHFSSS